MVDQSSQYQMLEELGCGSFGTVYKGIERATGDLVAIKVILLEKTDEDIMEIQSEIALLKACACPWVTAYKDSFVRGTKLWIIMEFMGGGSCLDLLAAGNLSEAHVAIVMKELLYGLDFLHNEGKMHRDIKAANILLNDDGKVKLGDFGVSAQLTNLKSQRHTFVGTPYWMAPEVIQEAGYDFKADIWSLGITAWELVHSKVPFNDLPPLKVLFRIPKEPAPRLQGSQYSRDYKDFVHCCLQKDPDKRPSAGQLLKHRFIRGAGKVEALKELVERAREFQAKKDRRYLPKLYQETLVTMSPGKDDSDAWVFDTIKQSTVATTPKTPVTKRRKLSVINANGQMYNDSDLLAKDILQLSLRDGPLSTDSPPPITVRKSNTALRKKSSIFQLNSEDDPRCSSPKREPEKRSEPESPTRQPPSLRSPKRAPLKADISFGNSPSTVRLFRRVSDKSNSSREPSPSREREISCHPLPALPPPSGSSSRRSISPSHRSNQTHNSNLSTSSTLQGSLPDLSHRHNEENHRPKTAGTNSSGERESSVVSKEILLGRRLYAKAVEPCLQELHAQTSNSAKRDALGKLADAFSALDAVDPEGQLLFFKAMIEKLGTDKKLVKELSLGGVVDGGLSGRSRSPSKTSTHMPVLSPTQEHTPTPSQPSSPKKLLGGPDPSTPSAGGGNSPIKLVLAQSNPHLRSHRRRQASGLGISTPSSAAPQILREERDGGDKEKLVGLPGRDVAGMGHLKDLADVLYGRWSEGLRGRWPNV